MRLDRNELSKAVRMALSLGAVAAVGAVGTAQAQDQTASQGQTNQPQTLQTIVVTGSHIRRVDLETANPVVTIDRAQIASSGKETLGDLVQELPAVTGSPQNPRVNNGGGSGASAVNLRGLGSARTLVLVNGVRVSNADLNIIPAELVERVEVLTDGGAVTYGSDAIGGVVNFILRSNYQGAEFSLDYGISDHDDGERRGASFIFGQTSDKGSILAGVDYNKQDPVGAGNRNFSKDALYLYYGNVYAFGSSRNPFGRAFLSTTDSNGVAATAPTQGTFGCSSVTRKGATGATGTGQALSDYRCYTGTDAYNYQTLNFDLTPQERTNAFFIGTYQLSDNVQAYLNVFHNVTTSESAIAPLPFDAFSDGVVISKDSLYNPFGVDFGPSTGNTTASGGYAQYNFLTRWTGMGQRKGEINTVTDQGTGGLKGSFGQSSWQWDAHFTYGHVHTSVHTVGDLVYNSAFKDALGPSMIDPATGSPICVSTPGDASTVIAGCTPLNIFDQDNPTSLAIERQFLATLFSNNVFIERNYGVSANGTLWSLPAGDMQLAVGADYRKLYTNTLVDFLAITDPTTGTCSVPQSACSSPLRGGYNVKEAYGELFIPILKDLPFVRSLNVTLGGRYSKYSLAGSTSNYKLAVEWKPIDDLLLRGTVQDVFRAPTIGNLFRGPGGSAPPFLDPCIGLTSSELAAHSNACKNVPAGATFQSLQNGLSQTTGVVSGSIAGGVNLKPEFGRSFDFGFVYDPHFLPGLSVNVDVWRVYLNDTITTVDAQTIANVCFSNNSSPFCNLITRRANGQVAQIAEPTLNLGRLDTRGVDLGVQYRLPQVSWLPGQFSLALNGTYVAQYDNAATPGVPGSEIFHVAGHFYKGFGSHNRVRGQLGLNWKDGPWDASWRMTGIGPETIGSADPNQHETADGVFPAFTVRVPWIVYNNLQVGYNIEPINTKVSIGVDNVFDKQPPLFYQTNVLNADTDVNTYDTVGRFYWARATVKF